jgi:hypothetical protein
VIGVAETQDGCDNNELMPMIRRIEKSQGEKPAETVVDGGCVDRQQIEQAETGHEVRVYAPVKEEAEYESKGKVPLHVGPVEWRGR